MNKTLLYIVGGVALARLLNRGPAVGKIVDGRPPGITECNDGDWSTLIPGRGVCSYHRGWKSKVETKPSHELSRDQLQALLDDILLNTPVKRLNRATKSYNLMVLASPHQTRHVDENPSRYVINGQIQRMIWANDVAAAFELYVNLINFEKASEVLKKIKAKEKRKNLSTIHRQKYNDLVREHNRLNSGIEQLITRYEALHKVDKNKTYKREKSANW